MRFVDLTSTIGTDTYSPPSVNQPIEITAHYKEPGFWMVSDIKMMLQVARLYRSERNPLQSYFFARMALSTRRARLSIGLRKMPTIRRSGSHRLAL